MSSDQHSAYSFRDRADALVETREQSVKLGQVRMHIHAVEVQRGLVPVAHVHHLNEGRPVHGLSPVLQDRHVHRGVRLLEVLGPVLALQHVDLDVFVVEAGDLAVQQQGATVSVQGEPNNVDFVRLNTFDDTRSRVSLVLAESSSHYYCASPVSICCEINI